MQTPLDLALEMQGYNLATVPIREGTKRAAVKWKPYQTAAPTTDELYSMFARPNVTVAVLCGEPSERLLVLDCDNHRKLDEMLTALDCPDTWVIESARGGHIYFRTPTPVASSRVPGMDIKAQANFVLAPEALHPSGKRYKWLNRTPTIKELPSLDAIPGITLKPASIRPYGMPRRAWALLTDPKTTKANGTAYDMGGSGGASSGREFAALISLHNSGWTWNQILTAFNKHAHSSGVYAQKRLELGHLNAEAWLQADYFRAVQYARTHEQPARQQARSMQAWAIDAPWKGSTGAIDQAVIIQHAKIAERVGQLTYGASCRELAEMAGISAIAVSHAHKRLLADPRDLLTIETPHTPSFPTRWTLKVGDAQNLYNHTNPPKRDCIGLARLDAFRWQGLGKGAAQIYALLMDGNPRTAEEIAKITGKHIGTVRKLLAKMEGLGMVKKQGCPAEWTALPVDLNEIAHRLETSGIGVNQRMKHAEQRRANSRELWKGAKPQ